MELTLYTEGFFDASHYLNNYTGKCSNIHGHSWKVSLWIKSDSSNIDNSGILWDFRNIKKILDIFDHKNLNDVIDVSPSVENITIFIYNFLKKEYSDKFKFKVRVYEQIINKESYCEVGDF